MLSAAQIISIVVFVAVMALVVSEKIHRALAALLGAVVLLVIGIIDFNAGMESIDFNTLGVLCGMMMFVAIVKESGLFEFVAIKSAKACKGNPWLIMIAFAVITAVFSAFLDNVTTVLLIGPMTIMLCKTLDINPVPFLLVEIMMSNVGGTATLIGDPPNIMIGSEAGLSFAQFIMVNAPIVVVIMVVLLVIFRFMYGRHLSVDEKNRLNIMELSAEDAIIDKALFHKSVVMIVLVAIAFMLHGVFNMETSVIALTAAAVIILISGRDIEVAIEGIEWGTIGFFLGLFMVVGGMEHTGVIEMLGNAIVDATGGNVVLMMIVILWASAILSSILDNIPFVATMIPIIMVMEASGIDVYPLWWALSLGACLGGNGTLVGASANVVLSGIANKEGYNITFMSFTKVAFPLMLVTVALSTIYLLILF
ncbi:ArsB/NhaD family transporter [Ellagibacter isourolithinifaciens]|uniref:ArsB/NhaD family transporter n=1 Tax=Ellagibacter isourolithinifaciens TaxID=2137581 RepID=UPI002E76249F|nr:ArsB/NhaD family transporter [Ellagibacter isourolithinifaciens]MEE0043851.1 ArsB/NhaD family transporter [Ellagibacter isourolithinifaciens]